MLQGKNHGVINEHAAGLFVDWGGDDVRVDGYRDVAGVGVVVHLDGGVFCAEELAQVFVEHENQFGNSCGAKELKKHQIKEKATQLKQ